MNTDKIVRIGFLAAVVVGGFLIYDAVRTDPEREAAELAARQAAIAAQAKKDARVVVHLDRVIDLTVGALSATHEAIKKAKSKYESEGKDTSNMGPSSFSFFMGELEKKYNAANPPLISGKIGVGSTKAAKLVAYHDKNDNGEWDSGSDTQEYSIEVDGKNSRIIATDYATGTVHDRTFTQQQKAGGGLMTGLLLGHMMGRQRSYGSSNSVQNKQRVSPSKARSNARSRAGSGSHRRGK